MAYVPVTLTAEKRAELEDEHGEVIVMKGTERSPWLVVLKRPNRQQTLGFKAWLKKDDTTASEELISRITVFPDPKGPDFERQLERWPLFCDGIIGSKPFQDFLGLVVDEDVKK